MEHSKLQNNSEAFFDSSREEQRGEEQTREVYITVDECELLVNVLDVSDQDYHQSGLEWSLGEDGLTQDGPLTPFVSRLGSSSEPKQGRTSSKEEPYLAVNLTTEEITELKQVIKLIDDGETINSALSFDGSVAKIYNKFKQALSKQEN